MRNEERERERARGTRRGAFFYFSPTRRANARRARLSSLKQFAFLGKNDVENISSEIILKRARDIYTRTHARALREIKAPPQK